MYNDNTILTKGKYKFTKLCRVPPEYLVEIYNTKDKSDIELFEYVKENMMNIFLRLTGEIPTEKLKVCDKIYFPSEKDAKKEINRIALAHQKNNVKPKRAYECQYCSGWHLTSSEIDEYKEKQKQYNS
jgi:hypothetical protein